MICRGTNREKAEALFDILVYKIKHSEEPRVKWSSKRLRKAIYFINYLSILLAKKFYHKCLINDGKKPGIKTEFSAETHQDLI